MDRATANLPSADFGRTAVFYAKLGFAVTFKDAGWMILERGSIVLEFFPLAVDPAKSFGSACVRVDDLDALYSAFAGVGKLTEFCRATPGLLPINESDGLRIFILIDPDGNLLRCLDNHFG